MIAGWGRSHPVARMPRSDWARCVPLTFHWDEVKYGRTSGADSEMFCVSFGSALSRGQVCVTRFPWCQIPVYLATAKTHEALVRLVVEEVHSLMSGLLPSGEPVSPQHHLYMFAGIKFDLKAKP